MQPRGTKINATDRDLIRDRLNLIVTAVNAIDKVHRTKPNGAPTNNPFRGRWPISGSYSRLYMDGSLVGGAGSDGSTTYLGNTLTVRNPVTSAEFMANPPNVNTNIVINQAALATFIRTVFSTLSRCRMLSITKIYRNFGFESTMATGSGMAHYSSDQKSYAAVGTMPGVGDFIYGTAGSPSILTFITELETDLTAFRATGRSFVEYWCHTNCHGSCHGARGRR
mgnify:FL=1